MDSTQRKMRQVQRMAETAMPLQPAENHLGPGREYTMKPHEGSVLKMVISLIKMLRLRFQRNSTATLIGTGCKRNAPGYLEMSTFLRSSLPRPLGCVLVSHVLYLDDQLPILR
jgi:hypothetical protein